MRGEKSVIWSRKEKLKLENSTKDKQQKMLKNKEKKPKLLFHLINVPLHVLRPKLSHRLPQSII
ncbi:unnamed protein product [Meloidogyne enterolobii]|uniref:Uncharacterized protein n=1 Tax=Meloidogyne enterolobii TaxID=390850 RepID=A0ACB1AKI1_MELEN